MWPKTHGIRIYGMVCTTFGIIAFWWGGKWQQMNYYGKNKGIGHPNNLTNLICVWHTFPTLLKFDDGDDKTCNDNELHDFDLCVISTVTYEFRLKEWVCQCVSVSIEILTMKCTHLVARWMATRNLTYEFQFKYTLFENEHSTICFRKEPIQMKWLRIARVKSLLKP